MNNTEELGQLIKAIRKNKELSQKQLSVLVHGSENHHAAISRIESGKLKEVQFCTINNILKALDIDIIELIQQKSFK